MTEKRTPGQAARARYNDLLGSDRRGDHPRTSVRDDWESIAHAAIDASDIARSAQVWIDGAVRRIEELQEREAHLTRQLQEARARIEELEGDPS